jgi:hypothetical protein
MMVMHAIKHKNVVMVVGFSSLILKSVLTVSSIVFSDRIYDCSANSN